MANVGKGLGGAATGAASGAAIGSVVPGIGTVIGGAVGGLIGGIGGLFGGDDGEDERKIALDLINQSVAELEAIGIPPIEAQKLALEKYRRAGILTPELEQYFQAPDSQMAQIQTDPALREAQLGGLSKLQEIIDSGGHTLEDKAVLAEIQNNIAAKERGSRDAILSDMRQRGASGSGLELAAQLQNQQGAASRANAEGLGVAAQAQKRALDSLMARTQMAGSIRGQDFSEAEKKAQAADLMNRFNVSNRQDVQQRNAAIKNNTNQYNLDNDQRIMNANTNLSNQEQIHNKGLIQSQFDNEMRKATAANNARASAATQYNNAGDRAAASSAGVAESINKAGTSLGSYFAEKPKSNDDDDEPEGWF